MAIFLNYCAPHIFDIGRVCHLDLECTTFDSLASQLALGILTCLSRARIVDRRQSCLHTFPRVFGDLNNGLPSPKADISSWQAAGAGAFAKIWSCQVLGRRLVTFSWDPRGPEVLEGFPSHLVACLEPPQPALTGLPVPECQSFCNSNGY